MKEDYLHVHVVEKLIRSVPSIEKLRTDLTKETTSGF